MDTARARATAVIIAESPPGSGVHEAGRVARLHPETPVFVLASSGTGVGGAIFDLLHPFEPGLLIDGDVPEDTWTRVARHWHECYRLSHPLPPGHPQSPARLPWPELDPFLKQDNILELRSILSAVVSVRRRWAPVAPSRRGASSNSATGTWKRSHGPSTRAGTGGGAHGWSAGRQADGTQADGSGPLVNSRVVPWAELPAADRRQAIDYLRFQLAQLEDVGFMPVVPPGGPAGAADFERIGTVRGAAPACPPPLDAAIRRRTAG